MAGRHRKVRTRRKLASFVVTCGLASAVSPLYFIGTAHAAGGIPSHFTSTIDAGGANDAASGVDLTQMGRDDTDPNTYDLFWSWSNTTWTGSNTGDACALFDSNNNGNIDYAVCAEVGADPGSSSTVVQTASSPTSWTCDDSAADRCAGPPVTAASGATVGTLDSMAASPPADLVTDTDPFSGGGANSTVQVQIPKSSLPTGAALANVCSYASISAGGNTAPGDCILAPGSGSLVIHKDSENDNSTVFPFTVDPGSVPVDVTGDSSSAAIPLAAGTNYSVAELVPSGWVFAGAFCELQKTFAGTGTQTATGVDGITIEPGKVTTCIFEDHPQSPDMSLTKTATPSTFSAAGETIHYTLRSTDAGANTLFGVTISDPMLGGDLTDCTDGGGNAVDPTASSVSLDAGQSLTCTGTYVTKAGDVAAGKIVNTATARAFEGEETPVYRSATSTIRLFVPPPPPPGAPTLGITKTSVPPTSSVVERGDQVDYTITYGNTGTAAAAGVTVTDTLPADLDYVAGSASNNGTYDAATRTLTWQIGAVATATSGTVTYSAVVGQSASDGETLHNVAVIAAPGITDPSNGDDVTVTVPPPPTGAVTISKAVDKAVAKFGDTLTYSVAVGATGNKNQTHVVASDTVPAGTSYVAGSATCDAPCVASESNGVVTWNVGTLAPGTSAVGRFKVAVVTPAAAANGGIAAEKIANVAQVTFDADPIEFSNKVQTAIAAVLGVKVVRPTQKTPTPKQPAVLPFTGLALPLPMSLLQLVMMATFTITAGTLLARRGRDRRVAMPVAVVQWRDQ